jgi:uroporphyrinogen-III synthase
MRRLLVLRPEPGASATVERARKLGLDARSIPLFEIEPIEWEVPEVGNFDGLLLTSANALRLGGDKLRELRGLPVYAVGDATADAAREAGFDVASAGDSGIERLLGSIDADLRLLHLCGEERREAATARQAITDVVLYRSKVIECPDLSAATGSVALVHSPRAGERFAELVRDRASTAIAGFSTAAAEAVGDGWEAVEAASAPNDDALLALAARLCNKPHPD